MNNEQEFARTLISIFNTFLGVSNLEKNTEQNKKQEEIIQSLEEHLKEQDKQYEHIISLLEGRKDDSRRNL